MGRCRCGQEVKLRIHTHVREDALILFGFLGRRSGRCLKIDHGERDRAKLAITVLSGVEAGHLITIIRAGKCSN